MRTKDFTDFGGATVRNILEFPQQFLPGICQQVRLTTNYRSHPDIIEFYNGWMDILDWAAEDKTFRYQKTILPNYEKGFTDVPAVLKVSGDPDADNWHGEVLAFLHQLKNSGALTDWNQVVFPISIGEKSEGYRPDGSVGKTWDSSLFSEVGSIL